MYPKYKPTLTLALTDEQKDRLREIARSFNLLIERGAMCDSGSIQKLITGISDGEFIIIPQNGDGNEQQ